MNQRKLLPIFIATLLLSACVTPPPGPFPTDSPLPAVSPLTSPLPAAAVSATPFQIERPLIAGATEVRGTGPAGVPVFIADVTFMGEPLGVGTIGPDGKFVVSVPALPDTHRIGLALGVLDGTQWKAEDFYRPEFFGKDSMQAPQVGFFHDTVLVGQK